MSDSIDPNRLAGLQGIADARDAFDAASVRADAATFDWFAADDAGLRLPITLAGGGSGREARRRAGSAGGRDSRPPRALNATVRRAARASPRRPLDNGPAMGTDPFALGGAPDWHDSAARLVAGLGALDDQDARVRLLEALCRRLGQQLYPAFLQLLLTLERFADDEARRLVADTLVHCLLSGRLPSGALSAWGATRVTGDGAFGQVRRLGPIEYVCAWYAQPSDQSPLSRAQLDTILGALLRLVSSDARAAELYRRKLAHDADDPLGGALSNRTRGAMRDLVSAWEATDRPEAAVTAYLDALADTSLLTQLARGPADFPR